jgi:hypothetical protein
VYHTKVHVNHANVSDFLWKESLKILVNFSYAHSSLIVSHISDPFTEVFL